MKNLILSTVASAGLVLALATLPASAQAPADPAAPAQPGAAAPAQLGDAANPFTIANIDPAAPFGMIDVTAAGPSVETVKAWHDTLNADLQTELTNRCEVIAANQTTFPESARDFCQAWETVLLGEPGAMGAQEVVPGPAMAPAAPGAPAAPAPAPAPGAPAAPAP